MKPVCFYNHWHNGDCFAVKGWIQSIMKQYPDIAYVYAHPNNQKILADGPEYLHVSNLPAGVSTHERVVEVGGVVFINTWCGAYGSQTFRPGEIHANWLSLHKQSKLMASYINAANGTDISFSDNVLEYVAETDWDYYDVSAADEFVSLHPENLHLICNGLVRSTQSNIGDMKSVIEELAARRPRDSFICTSQFETNCSNIYFTNDIFNLDGDINEIAYLSTKCKTIVGKNSGPFMFAHVKDNINDPSKSFVSLSHRYSDSYVCDVEGIACHYYHCSSDDNDKVLQSIETAMNATGTHGGRAIVLD